jgi:hypothetical protein
VGEGVKVDELLDLAGEPEERAVHDVGEVARQRLHVIAGLRELRGGHPVVFGRVDQVVDLGVDELEDALLGRLLVFSELLCSGESQGPAGRGRRPGSDEELFELLAGGLKVLQVDQDLYYLT